MNHLVVLDAQASELEKILSGVKTMLVKEIDPSIAPAHPVHAGDSLYFLRSRNESTLRVKATVIHILPVTTNLDEGISLSLKEMQSKLQLTENQFNIWSRKKQVLLVEFAAAQKIPAITVAQEKLKEPSPWIAFDEFSLIT